MLLKKKELYIKILWQVEKKNIFSLIEIKLELISNKSFREYLILKDIGNKHLQFIIFYNVC